MRACLALLLILTSTATAAPKRRAVGAIPIDTSTPAGWLALHATRLHATELPAPTDDLVAFGNLVAGADVVGLGDGTHGTHEFSTIKLRLIDYLVREKNFDVVSFEGPLPFFDRLDQYVQNGTGDPRSLLAEVGNRLGYKFWDTEEILAVVEWVRQYNAHRGDRLPVHIAGADIFDGKAAAEVVLAWLRTVDPASAASAQKDYECVLGFSGLVIQCNDTSAKRVRDQLSARRAELSPISGAASFENALQHAVIVTQNLQPATRDQSMALNVEWHRQHRSESKRVIYWAHGEHVGKIQSVQVSGLTTGMSLNNVLGTRYVVVGTLTGGGNFRTWNSDGVGVTPPVPAPIEGTYEWWFQLATAPVVLIPLSGEVPAWLAGPANYFLGGSSEQPQPLYIHGSLPQKLDAVIYFRTSSPTRQLQH